jgi:hypothetical protein
LVAWSCDEVIFSFPLIPTNPFAPAWAGWGESTREFSLDAYFCKHLPPGDKLVNARTSGQFGTPGKEDGPMATIGNKGWMLMWAGVSVFAVLCVYAAVSN